MIQSAYTGDSDFDHLTMDLALHLVEAVQEGRCTNVCRPLNSYINRVYEVELEDGTPLIAKFYRPGRWSREALQDEHDFMFELHDEEIPVVAPLRGTDGTSLHEHHHTFYALFPKKGGRICDEPNDDQWMELGRLVARVHNVGARKKPRDRINMGPREETQQQIDYILASGFVDDDVYAAYAKTVRDTVELIAPLFEDTDDIRIHGDLHFQNVIHRPGEAFYMIDFDDMALGPPVQDVWMLLPGRVPDALPEADLFLEGYETFRDFDRSTLRLVEALRAMRFIHYTAWCVRQAEDGGFNRLEPQWGSTAYWKAEVAELEKQQTEIGDYQSYRLPW
jgi:Ser/Thr protein kinase RdoA (MazF antagonist)